MIRVAWETPRIAQTKRRMMRDVAEEAAREYGVDLGQIRSRARSRAVVRARQEAMRRIRDEMGRTYPEIGQWFGLDHTTVIHGVRRARERLSQ